MPPIQPLRRRLDEVLVELFARIVAGDDPLGLHLVDRGEGQVGIDRAGTVARQQGEVLHLAGLARLDDESAAGPRAGADEVVVDAAGGEERRHRRLLATHAPVGEDDDRGPGGDRRRRLDPDLVETAPHAVIACGRRIEERDRRRLQPRHDGTPRGTEGLDPGALGVGDHRRLQPQQPGLLRRRGQQVPLAADRGDHRGDDLLTDRVERRIRHLRE